MPRWHIIGYGMLGLPLAFGALPVYIFVPDFYARTGLLGLSAIGVILLLTRLLDAFADPFFGWFADRHPRRRILIFAIFPFVLGFFALFLPPDSARAAPEIWLFCALALCTFGFSAAMIAYQAWGGDLGADTAQRLRLTGAREAFILTGVVIASGLPSIFSPDPQSGIQILPWCLLFFLIVAVGLIQRLPAGHQTGVDEPILHRLRHVMDDRIFKRLLIVFFANGIASAFPATLFVFYVADVLGVPDKTGLLLGSYFLAAALAVPMWVRCSQWLGRPFTWMLSMGLAMASFVGAGFLGPGDWSWFLLICLISGVAVGADLTIPVSLVADLGERRSMAGAYFGIWNLIAKINLALAAGIVLPLLGFFGYTPGSSHSLNILVSSYVMLPMVLKGVALLLLLRWRRELSITS